MDLKKISSKVLARSILAMAYDRNTFKDKIEEYVGGAMQEFFKAQLAEKNGKMKWVRHWRTEVNTLFQRGLRRAVQHSTKGNWNKRRAIDEVLKMLRAQAPNIRTSATNDILKDFEMRKLKYPLDESDTEAFFDLLEDFLKSEGF